MNKNLLYMFLLLIITSCGGGGGSDEPKPEPKENVAPTAPSAVGGQKQTCLSVRPTLRWNKSTDKNNDKLTYKVNFGASKDAMEVQANSLTTNQYTFSQDLLKSTKYYWEVIVSDGEFDVSGGIWEIATVGDPVKNTIPSTPVLKTPYGTVTDINVDFLWDEVVDDGTVTYTLFVKDEQNNKNQFELNSTTYTYSNMPRGEWSWWVIAKDADGNASQSATIQLLLK